MRAVLILSEIKGLSYQVAFLAYGSLNAREYIVNLNRVAVSSVCYYTSVPNECSSFTPGSITGIPDLIWLTKLMYDRGESWSCRAYYASSRSKITVETRLSQVSLFWPVFGGVVSKRNVLCFLKRRRVLCRLKKSAFPP
jgi:hypothetical protein